MNALDYFDIFIPIATTISSTGIKLIDYIAGTSSTQKANSSETIATALDTFTDLKNQKNKHAICQSLEFKSSKSKYELEDKCNDITFIFSEDPQIIFETRCQLGQQRGIIKLSLEIPKNKKYCDIQISFTPDFGVTTLITFEIEQEHMQQKINSFNSLSLSISYLTKKSFEVLNTFFLEDECNYLKTLSCSAKELMLTIVKKSKDTQAKGENMLTKLIELLGNKRNMIKAIKR